MAAVRFADPSASSSSQEKELVSSSLRAGTATTLRVFSGQRAPSSAWLETRISWIRWAGVIFITPALLFTPLGGHNRLPLLGVVAFAAFYNSAVPFLIKYRPNLLLPFLSVCDGIAAGSFVLVSGFNSQQYMVLYSIVVATAMRVGMLPVVAMTLMFTGLDFGQGMISGDLSVTASMFRSFFLILVGVLSAVLYQYAKREEELTREANEQLQAANEELLALSEMKNQFISNASHELRTPLTSIRSFSEMLTADPDLDRETRVEFMDIISSESERLSRLVNNLLDLGRIQAGGYMWNPQLYDLTEELGQVVVEQQAVATAKGLELSLDVRGHLPLVRADRDAIHQVLLNLTGNAIKFTERGQVRIAAWPDADRVVVSVQDTGVGIPSEEQALVFERFYQTGDVLTSKPAGSGLGLAICKEILERHGSTIELESRVGGGSTLRFWLPAGSE